MEPIQKKSTVDLAVEKLIEYVQSDSVAVGDKLPAEVVLCKELNISRTTMREAYRVLQSQGYLEIQIGKGAFVKSKERDFIQEAIEWISTHKVQMKDYLFVRMALDPLAARLAAENATQKDVDALCAIHKVFVEAVHRRDNATLELYDAKYHEQIAQITHNDLLLSLVRITNHYFRILRQTSFRFEEHVDHALMPHEQILASIAQKQPEKAAQASIEHMRTAFQDLCGWQPKP